MMFAAELMSIKQAPHSARLEKWWLLVDKNHETYVFAGLAPPELSCQFQYGRDACGVIVRTHGSGDGVIVRAHNNSLTCALGSVKAYFKIAYLLTLYLLGPLCDYVSCLLEIAPEMVNDCFQGSGSRHVSLAYGFR